jgi:hypothetical protein
MSLHVVHKILTHSGCIIYMGRNKLVGYRTVSKMNRGFWNFCGIDHELSSRINLHVVPTVYNIFLCHVIYTSRRKQQRFQYIIVNTTSKHIYIYADLLCYKQRGFLHVSATYCGHLQGGVLWRKYFIKHHDNLIYR